jgi:SulP family sulfate permease
MASLAALLVLVAWNMSEARNFIGVVRVAPKSDVAVLLTCYLLTVFFDMVIAISVGMVLASFMFMRRMASLTESRLRLESTADDDEEERWPPGVIVYEINGPLFFGAAQTAMSTLQATRPDGFKVLVLDLARVPVIDATGLVALENAISGVLRQHKLVVVSGPLPRPRSIFDKASLAKKYPGLLIAENRSAAFDLVREGAGPVDGGGHRH